MRILVDLDGVLADWGAEYGRQLEAHGEAAALIPRHADQRSFDLHDGRTPEERRIIKAVMVLPGFYSNLVPIDGGRTALREMLADGHDVRIVTSPWISNPTCASDKLNWVVRHLGQRFGPRTIITADKTLVRGDILLDDKPEVSGSMRPEWEHVLFTQPYNHDITNRRRIDAWEDWRSIL